MPDDTKQVDNTQNTKAPDAGREASAPADFTAWMEQQDDAVKSLYQTHTAGLKAALQSERETRQGLERQLRDAAAKAEAGSEAQKQLEEAAAKAEMANRQVQFFESAHAHNVADLRLAWLAVSADKALQQSDGTVNFEALREKHPSLFAANGAAKPPPGNAGAGAGIPPQKPRDMNDILRDALRRR